MKTISYRQTGPSSVLTMGEGEKRDPAPTEVRVRIVVSGVNPTDWKSRAGSGDGHVFESPQVPNQDGAGVVDAVGDQVTELRPGDRVWVWDAFQAGSGTAQQFATLPADQVVPLPNGASFDTGASLGIPALTAHRALTSDENGPARLAPGALADKVVLVTGGAGAVGHAAIQLARWAGATVITTVSNDEKAELARRAGAHHVINYRSENVADAVHAISERGAELIIDVDIAHNIGADLAALTRGGTIAAYALDTEPTLTMPIGPAMFKNVRIQFVLTYTVTAAQKAEAVAGVSAAVADGALDVGDDAGLPLTRFAFADTARAHDAVASGTVGKVLIDVSSPA